MKKVDQRKAPGDHSPPSNFLGVFFVGLVLLGITANYYLNKEAGEDREARSRRIATEVDHLQHTSSSVANSLHGR